MKNIQIVIIAWIASASCALADPIFGCMDISGTYALALDSQAECGPAYMPIAKEWIKYQKSDCQSLKSSRIYKFENGSFCEGPVTEQKAAEAWTPIPGEMTYRKTEFLPNRYIFSFQAFAGNPAGSSYTEILYKDSNGNLIIDNSQGFHEVILKSPAI